MNEPGTISTGENSALCIDVEGESYRIEPEEVRGLLFYCRTVPVYQVKRRITPDGGVRQNTSIVGHAAIDTSGREVLIFTRAGYYIIPVVSFRKVAGGEDVSAPLLPFHPDQDDGPT